MTSGVVGIATIRCAIGYDEINVDSKVRAAIQEWRNRNSGSLQKRKQFVNSDLGFGSRKVRDAGRRIQRLAGVRDRKDNELSEPAGDSGY